MVSSPHTEVRPITSDQGTHERAAEYRSLGRKERRVRVTQNKNMNKGIEKLHISSFDKAFLALAVAVS